MKILMLTTSYPRHFTDFRGSFIEELVGNLRQLGNEVDVGQVQGFDALTKKDSLLSNIKRSKLAALQFPFYLLKFCYIAAKRAKEADIIHANWTISGWAALASKFWHKKKIILTVRSPFLVDTQNKLIIMLMGRILKSVDKTITISEQSKKKLLKKYPQLRGKISVIRNGVDVSSFYPRNKRSARKRLKLPLNKKIILFVGRISKIKGLAYLITAFENISRKDLLLVIIGDGEYRKQLEKKTKNKNIIFTGIKRYKDIPYWMGASNVFVMPSLSETGGNVILEALSCGLPVITTRVGVAEEIIKHGRNGYLIKKRDPASIKKYLLKVLRDNSLTLQARVSEKVPDWKRCASEYIREYAAIL